MTQPENIHAHVHTDTHHIYLGNEIAVDGDSKFISKMDRCMGVFMTTLLLL